MELRETTKNFIAMLEQKSGLPVHVMEDASLPVFSSIKLARGNLLAHIITFKPDKNEPPDYPIIFQCAMAIRTFDCPPDDRKQIGPSPAGMKTLLVILSQPNSVAERAGLSGIRLEEFRDNLLLGLVTHIRSVPLSIRVSETLTLEHPELIEFASKHAERELQLNQQSLSERIREITPKEVFDPTQCINAAFAIFWSKRLGRPEIVNPYRLAGFESQGMELLDICNFIPNDPLDDCELIDEWGGALQIRDWYRWIPYEVPLPRTT